MKEEEKSRHDRLLYIYIYILSNSEYEWDEETDINEKLTIIRTKLSSGNSLVIFKNISRYYKSKKINLFIEGRSRFSKYFERVIIFLLVIALAVYMTLYHLKNDEYNKLKRDSEQKKNENKWFRKIIVIMQERDDVSHKKIIYYTKSL